MQAAVVSLVLIISSKPASMWQWVWQVAVESNKIQVGWPVRLQSTSKIVPIVTKQAIEE